MPLTETQYQTLLTMELRLQGDVEFVAMLPLWWEMEAPAGVRDPRLRYLLVRRHGLRYALQKAAEQTDWSKEEDGKNVRVSGSQEGVRLQALLEITEKELVVLEKRLAAGRAPATGTITREAPILRDDTVETLEAHERAYRGDPWRRS